MMHETYTVQSSKWGRAVIGLIPVDDLVALSKVWEAQGLKLMALDVSHALGASIAVVKTEADAKAWLKELGFGPDQDDWLKSGDTGISSETIFSVLSGRAFPVRYGPDIPYDPSDFGRCHRLLQRYPEWTGRLQEVADKHPFWKPFVDAWQELTDLWNEEVPNGTGKAPRLYARMQDLVKQSRRIENAQG